MLSTAGQAWLPPVLGLHVLKATEEATCTRATMKEVGFEWATTSKLKSAIDSSRTRSTTQT